MSEEATEPVLAAGPCAGRPDSRRARQEAFDVPEHDHGDARGTPHAMPEERAALGKEARRRSPRSGHAAYKPSPHGPDPLVILEAQSGARVLELVTIRYGRMMESPFRFYRGAAASMASDLARQPALGTHGPVVRGRAHAELPSACLTGEEVDVRHQRLRRDAAGPLGVGRQAAVGESRHRGPGERLGTSSGGSAAPCGGGDRLRCGSAGAPGTGATGCVLPFRDGAAAEQTGADESGEVDELAKLSEIKARGDISEEELRRAKEKILH